MSRLKAIPMVSCANAYKNPKIALRISQRFQASENKGRYRIKCRNRSFLGGINLPTSNTPPDSPSLPEREIIKHTLIGSSKAITGTIRVLHQLGYADINDWSPLVPSPNPGELMSILIRSISVQ